MQQTDIETDIEAALIGCLMLDYPGTVSETADFSITPEMFVSGLARQTFEAIQSLAADKSPVDPLTVRQKLGRYGEGGEAISAFLCGAIDITPTAAHAGYYGQLLRQRQGDVFTAARHFADRADEFLRRAGLGEIGRCAGTQRPQGILLFRMHA